MIESYMFITNMTHFYSSYSHPLILFLVVFVNFFLSIFIFIYLFLFIYF